MLTFTKIYVCHRVGQNEHLHDSNEKIEFEGNIPCTHEMRTMHLNREQVGCTVHVKKREKKKEKEGAQAA